MKTSLTLTLLVLASSTAACTPSSDVSDPGPTTDNLTASSLEKIPADEPADTVKLAQLIADAVKKNAATDGKALRGVHPKSHGCTTARLEVTDALPGLSSTVFAPGKKYDAWIRFSNANQRPQSDREPDSRGMAVKLLGVPGPRLVTGEDASTLDLTFQNLTVFFIRNVKDFVDFAEATKDQSAPLDFFFPSLNPFKWRLHEGQIVQQIRSKKTANPLDASYFTTAPLTFGSSAVKMSVQPCTPAPPVGDLPDDANYLRAAMRKSLAAGDACFELLAQKQGDPKDMPIEDPTIEWDQARSPYTKIARLTIPKQEFDTPAQNAYCEDLSFTPWHGVVEHRPVGGINRARKVVYDTSSKVRHELNGFERKPEPTDLQIR